MNLEHTKVIRTLRLSLTCIFLFLITWYFQVPESGWALVTIWFVMYEYNTVGGVLAKSILRLTGTSLSAIYGLIVIYYCGNNPIINMLALIPGLFIYSYFFMGGTKTYIGTIGAVTLTIVLLNYNDVDAAIIRVFDVFLGILASMFMIRFFYPQYAKDQIVEIQVKQLEQLLQHINNYLDLTIPFEQVKTQCVEQELQLISSLSDYSRLLNEARIETKNNPGFVPGATKIMNQLRGLCRLLEIFVVYLSTDELRTDPWVHMQLHHLYQKLNTIKIQLIQHDDSLDTATDMPSPSLIEDPSITEITCLENKHAAESLIQEMHETVTLLQHALNRNPTPCA